MCFLWKCPSSVHLLWESHLCSPTSSLTIISISILIMLNYNTVPMASDIWGLIIFPCWVNNTSHNIIKCLKQTNLWGRFYYLYCICKETVFEKLRIWRKTTSLGNSVNGIKFHVYLIPKSVTSVYLWLFYWGFLWGQRA